MTDEISFIFLVQNLNEKSISLKIEYFLTEPDSWNYNYVIFTYITIDPHYNLLDLSICIDDYNFQNILYQVEVVFP